MIDKFYDKIVLTFMFPLIFLPNSIFIVKISFYNNITVKLSFDSIIFFFYFFTQTNKIK